MRTERSSGASPSPAWDTMTRKIEEEFGYKLTPYHALKKKGLQKNCDEATRYLDTSIDRLFGNRITQQQRISLYARLAVWIVHELQRRQLPLTDRTALQGMYSLERELDIKFPGYIQAGLIHWILGGKHG